MNGAVLGFLASPLITGVLLGARGTYRTLTRRLQHWRTP